MILHIYICVYSYIYQYVYLYPHLFKLYRDIMFFLSGMQRRVCRGATHVLQMGQEELLRAGAAAGDGKISGFIGMLLFHNSWD